MEEGLLQGGPPGRPPCMTGVPGGPGAGGRAYKLPLSSLSWL